MSSARLLAPASSEETRPLTKAGSADSEKIGDDKPARQTSVATNGTAEDEGHPAFSSVQFSCGIFYGEKSHGEVELDIIRIRALDTVCKVKYSTHDGSAKAGVTYKSVDGWLTFEPGEYLKSISVPFVHSDLWSATVEFQVVLTEPAGCILGSYLHTCRIKVMDDNVFPTNKYRAELERRDFEAIPGLSLFWAYARWNAVTGELIRATILTLIFDQLSNIYQLMIIYIDMYLVNTVLALDKADEEVEDQLLWGSRYHTVCFIAGLHFFPWFLMLGWLYVKNQLDTMNISSQHLQCQMYRKYMNFSPSQIAVLGPEQLEFGLLTEAPIVASGYDASLTLFQKGFNVLMNVYLVAYSTFVALPIIGLVMLTVVLWAAWRERYTIPVVKKETTMMTHLVKEAAGKHDLICQYQIRPQMNHFFEDATQSLRDKLGEQCDHIWTTDFVLSLVAPFFMAAYMVLNVQKVLDPEHELKLGTFLGVIKIINTVASETCGAYKTFGNLVHTFGMLRNITAFYNMHTEVAHNMEYNRARRKKSREILTEMSDPSVDMLPIYCQDLSLSFGQVDLLEKVSLQIPQGIIVGIHGPNSSGKNMLVRILANMTNRSGGNLFLPSHLRTLLVTREPTFLDKPLIVNLTLGKINLKASDIKRLKKIMQELELHKLLKIIDDEWENPPPEEAADNWSQSLSQAYKTRVSLARAFFMNPEVMLMQRPLAMFSTSMMERIKTLIMDHSRNKGLHVGNDTVHLRRPRTVIFTSDTSDRCKGSDMICEVYPSGRTNINGDPVFSLRVTGSPHTA